MEIQTFLLARDVNQNGHNQFYGAGLGITNFYPLDGKFPLAFSIPYFMVLRREDRGAEAPMTIQFDLVDADGHPAGLPNDFIARMAFPAGALFYYFMGNISFSFPGPGIYRLDIHADGGDSPFSYNLEITNPNPAAA